MAERKVLNKYIDPNFDYRNPGRKRAGEVSAVPKSKKVRLMAPFSMQCETCGDYIYKGKKFNARKEDAEGEKYLGIQIYRFFIRCPSCMSEISFKTDPKNTDYVADKGAVRNFEPWRDATELNAEFIAEREREEMNDPLKALENRTRDAKREMDILDALDEIRTRNALIERVDAGALLDKFHNASDDDGELEDLGGLLKERQEELEDEEFARSIFRDADGDAVKRLSDSVEPSVGDVAIQNTHVHLLKNDSNHIASSSSFTAKVKPDSVSQLKKPLVILKKKSTDKESKMDPQNSKILGVIGAYESSSDDE